MCEYYNGNNNVLAEKTVDIGKLGELTTYLEFSTDGDDYFLGAYSDFWGKDETFGDCIIINHCPMCGRKLTEE